MAAKQTKPELPAETAVEVSAPTPAPASTAPATSSVQFVIRSYRLQATWCWLRRFRATGALFALLSVLFWSFNGLSYKLNHQIHALETLTISSFVVSVGYLGFMFLFYGVHHYGAPGTVQPFGWSMILGVPGERTSLVMRCICGTVSLGCFYSSYRYIPLGDATTIRFTSPVFISIFAYFLIKEPFGALQVVNGIATLIGVILVGRPSFLFGSKLPAMPPNGTGAVESPVPSAELPDWWATLVGVLLSLVAAITISISMIFMRKIRKTPPPLVIFWFSLSNVVLGAIGLVILGEYRMPDSLISWLLILMTVVCTGSDQLFITLALKMEHASVVAVIQALCVVFSFLFSISILHEPLYWTSALGGLFIFFSVLVLGCSKLLQDLDYSRIKSMIFTINILHSHSSRSFKLEDRYSMLSAAACAAGAAKPGDRLSSKLRFDTIRHHRHLHHHRHHDPATSEPCLLRVASIDGGPVPPLASLPDS